MSLANEAVFLIILISCFLTPLPLSYSADINYSYDALNRLSKVDYGQGVYIAFVYDEIGNIISVNANGTPIIPGDLDDDGEVTLKDVITGLRVLVNDSRAGTVNIHGDTNNDGKLGLEDVLKILRSESEGQ